MESYTERVYMEVLRWRVVRDPQITTSYPQTAPRMNPILLYKCIEISIERNTWRSSDGGWLVTLRNPGCVYSPTNST